MGARLRFRPDIEGLRGIAVLLVVLYHAGVPGFDGGFVGVDVFFVLSGYLITRLLVDELRATGTVSLRCFYARRVRRLLPAAALVIVATLAVSQLVLSPLRQVEVASSAMAAAAYAANVVFAVESADYFGADVSTNPMLHMWSLSVEEQFYLVWPVLLLLAWRLGGRRGLTAALAIVAIGGLAFSVWLVDAAPQWAFYGTHSRAWQFAVGGLVGLLTLRTSPMLVGLGWAGLAAILTSGALLADVFPFPGLAAVPVTVGTAAALLTAGAAPSSLLGVGLSTRPLRELGRLSYSWYLWHWPALVLAEAAWGPLSMPARLAVAAGALALSEAAYRLVENPVRHAPRLVASPRLSFTLLAGLLIVTVGAANGSNALTRARIGGDPLRITAAANDYERVYADGCAVYDENEPQEHCWYGDPRGHTTVVLYGDSHASQWFPALNRLAVERGWHLAVRVKYTCGVSEIPTFDRDGRETTYCPVWRAAVLEELERLQPDVVVAAWYATHPSVTPDPAALTEGLRLLGGVAGRVVYVRDVPPSPVHVPDCLLAGRGSCEFDASANAASAWEVQAAADAGAHVVDLTQVLCPGGVCPAVVDGMVTYRDRHHFTAAYSSALAGALGEALDGQLARVEP